MSGDQLADFRAQTIGFIFQDFNLLETLTARENIALPLALQNVPSGRIAEDVDAIAQRLGITPILDSYPSAISGGQKQRVAAARALVHKPAILFGDEPPGALDSQSARELLETMKMLNTDQEVPILLVTHDPFSASYAQRILLIKDGVIGQEIKRGDRSREEFYRELLDVLGTFQN